MKALIAGFFVAFLLALGLTPWVRALALRLGALDHFSARKVVNPAVIVPRLGGLAIAAAFYLSLLFLFTARSALFLDSISYAPRAVALLLFGLPILLLGCIDDLRGMNAWTKLAVQVGVAVLLFYFGLRVDGRTSLWDRWELPVWMSFVLTVTWIVGVINAVNLIDGLDGLASGVAFFALCATGVIAVLRGDLALVLLTVTLAGAVLGFLVFNWNPASIFMGDAGSMFLGYLLATMSIWTVQKAATAVLVVFPAVALGLPLLDTSLTIGRRLLSGRPVMQADRDHVHHRLLGRGLSHRQTVVLLYAVCAVFSGLSVAMAFADRTISKLLLLLSGLFALGLAWVLGYVQRGPHGIFASLHRRSRNRALLQRLGALGTSLSRAGEVAELQEAVREFAAALATVDLRLTIGPEQQQATQSQPALGTSYPIRTIDGIIGRVESQVDEMRITPDDRVLMQLLCDMLAPQLRRLTGRRSGRFPLALTDHPVPADLKQK